MRAVGAWILLLLVVPTAHAQTEPESALAIVELRSPRDDQLSLTLIRGSEGVSSKVNITRPSSEFIVARIEDVVPEDIDRIELLAPDGWSATSTREILVFGRDLVVTPQRFGDVAFRTASVGEIAQSDRSYLSRAIPFLRSYHVDAPKDVLLVRAPASIASSPLFFNDSIVISRDASTEALATALVRWHQGYRVVEVAPASAAWFREGEERFLSQLSLMAAGERSAVEVAEVFTRAGAVADPDARLPQAPAGSTLARQKGLVVVHALDAELRNLTEGRASLADLLPLLDAQSGRLDSVAIEELAASLGGDPIAPFFERYVYGSEWPPNAPVRDGPDVVVTALKLDPIRAAIGEQVVVTYSMVNRGTQQSALDLSLALDGRTISALPVRLAVGASTNGTLTLEATEAGDRVVTFGARSAPLHVLSPARLILVRATTTPEGPKSGDPITLLVYVENLGEVAGRARIEVFDAGRLVQRTTEVTIAGGSTDAFTLPLVRDEAGLHILDIQLVAPDAESSLQHELRIGLSEEARSVPIGLWMVVLAVALAATRRGG